MPPGFQSWLKRIAAAILIYHSTIAVKAQDEKLLPEMDYSSGLQSNAVRCIKVVKSGNIYVGTDNGLNILGGLTAAQNAIIQQIGNKSIWGLEIMDSILFIGTRLDGLQLYHISTGKQLYNYPSSFISLIRKTRVLQNSVFVLTNNGAYKWQNAQLIKINYKKPSDRSFVIDVFEFKNKIYGITYPENQIVGYNNTELGANLNKELSGKEFDTYFQSFCVAVDSDKVYFPSCYGDKHLLTIREPDRSTGKIQIFKGLPAGYIIWDMQVLGSKIILAVGDTYSNEKGFVYVKDLQQDFVLIEPTDFVNCVAVDSVNNLLYYGTLNSGLYCQQAISHSQSIQMPSKLKFSTIDSNISINGHGEVLSLKNGKYTSVMKSNIKYSDSYLSASFLGNIIFVSSNKDIKTFDIKSLKEINILTTHPLITNELATSETLSIRDSANKTVNFLYRFDSYGQVRKYNLNTGSEVVLNNIDSYIPVTLKQGGKIYLQNKEKGFCIIDGVNAYTLSSNDGNVPFARDFTVIRDTLYVLIRNYLEELRIDYKYHALIPIRVFSTTNLCEGFLPQWIMSKSDKLYLLNSNGILKIDPRNGSPLSYYYFGNNFKIQKPVVGGNNLIWATVNMFTSVPFDEIDKPVSTNNATILSLKFPVSQNENIDFKAESSIRQYLTQNHSLKSLEIWYGGKRIDTKYAINNTFSFNNGLKYGDYNLVLRAGNSYLNKLLSISLPLNRNPYFFGSILVLVMAILILFLKNIFNIRSSRRKLSQVRLQSLKQNLNPHFVHNSMNLISSLILEEKYDDAVQVVADFSNLQRTYLETNNKDMISLDEELKFLKSYLDLQQKRFKYDNIFEYSISVSPEIDSSRIMLPPLILQPIAENAIRYGVLSNASEIGLLRIDVISDKNKIIVRIEDNGLKQVSSVHGFGLGQKLVAERIALYNSTFGVNILIEFGKNAIHSNSGYRVELVIPI